MKHLQCVVIGDRESNLIDLLNAFALNIFPDDSKEKYHSKEGYSANVFPPDGPPVILRLQDIIYVEEQRIKTRSWIYPITNVFLLCFSLIRPKTLECIENLCFPEIHELCPRVPIVLVGLESDLRDDFDTTKYDDKDIEPIPTSKGEKVAKLLRVYKYVEVSVAKCKNLAEVFDEVAKAGFTYNTTDGNHRKEEESKQKGCEIF